MKKIFNDKKPTILLFLSTIQYYQEGTLVAGGT